MYIDLTPNNLADPRIGCVLAVSLSCCGPLSKHLSLGTEIAVVICVIDVLMFSEKSFLGLRSRLRHNGAKVFKQIRVMKFENEESFLLTNRSINRR